MSDSITERSVGDVTILDIAGRITLGEEADSLRGIIRELEKQGRNKVILNLAETFYVDSSGVGEIVSGFMRITTIRGGQLKLLALQKRVQDMLQYTKLYTVFEVFDDEDAAIRSFQ